MNKRQILRLLLASVAGCAALHSAQAQEAGKAKVAEPAAPQVLLTTALGNITLQLESEKAPKSVANFLQYVDEKHYDGTVFHRVIKDFMIQGGGFTPDMVQKATRMPITLEAANGLKNTRGTVAMARTMVPHSATSQFFINVKDNDFLNAKGASDGYAVFGKVIEGMDVVDKIREVKTGNKGGYSDVPVETVEIISAKRIN